MNRRRWLFGILLLQCLAAFIWYRRWKALKAFHLKARKLLLPPHQNNHTPVDKQVPIPKKAVVDTLSILLARGEGQVSVIPDGVRELKRLISSYGTDVYLLTKCVSDEEENRIRQLLIQENIPGLDPHKLLFYETEVGCIHMARQLEPDLVICGSLSMLMELEKWVPNLLCTGEGTSDGRVMFGNMCDVGAK